MSDYSPQKATTLRMPSSPLQLVPLVRNGRAKGWPLSLELGRIELATWWLTSCCRRRRERGTDQPDCTFCKNTRANAKFLSKSMFQIDGRSNTMHITGKNDECMFLNDVSVANVEGYRQSSGIQIEEGDVLSFREEPKSPLWMKFEFRSVAKVVTPETLLKRHRKRDCQTSRGAAALNKDCALSDTYHTNPGKDSPEPSVQQAGDYSRPVVKRRRSEHHSEPPSTSKRKLFPSQDIRSTDARTTPPHQNTPVSHQQRYHDPVTSSCETPKQGLHTQQYEVPSSDESSLLSLPRFPSCEDEAETLNNSGGPCKNAQQEADGPVETPLSDNSDGSSDAKPVSELTYSQWKSMQVRTKQKSSVGRALVNLVLANNSGRDREMWLPALLEGTTIAKTKFEG